MSNRKSKPGSDRERWFELRDKKNTVRKNVRKSGKYLNSLSKLKISPVDLSEKKPTKRILTGTALDRMLSRVGGVEAGSTVEFYGIFATGKTQICEALAVEAEALVIFIDAEHTLRKERLREIAEARGKDFEDVLSRMLYFAPEDWIEQEAITLQLPEFDSDDNFIEVGLIVVDSLMKTWASSEDFFGRENLTDRQQKVRAQLDRLASYARRHKGVLVYTNQVYDKPVDTQFAPPENKIGSRGGRTVEHVGDYRIFIRKGRGNVRFARLVDSPDLPLLEIPFILDESGIRDIEDPIERAKAVVMSDKYGTKFLSGQVGMKAAGKEHKIEALKLGYITVEEAKEMNLTDKEIKKGLNAQLQTMDERLYELSEDELEILELEKIPEKEEEDDKISDDSKVS